MSRRQNDGSVRGPTSALTSFLKGLGVEPQIGNPYGRVNATDAGPSSAPADDTAGPSTSAPPAEDIDSDDLDAPPPKRRRRAVSVDSDDLDAEDSESPAKSTPAPSRAQSRTASARRSGASTPAAKPGALKGVGEFMDCGECGKKFTVTVYTKEHPTHASTFICVQCCPKLGVDPYARPKKPRAAPAARKKDDRKKIVHYEVKKGAPPLADLCIKMIGKYIEEVEALGDIGAVNMDKVCKIICKSRRLTSETATLFFDAQRTELKLYDCTNLVYNSYDALANLCPNLVSLNLQYCGQLQTDTLTSWSTSLKKLRDLELFAPFLARKEGWLKFLRSKPKLRSFVITQSPRIDLEVIETLVKSCPNLETLGLTEIGQMGDDFLVPLSKLKHLERLTISSPGDVSHPPLSDDAVIDLISKVGKHLTSLDLSDNPELGDEILPALLKYCPRLTRLSLRNVDLSDVAVAEYFTGLHKQGRPPFTYLDLEKGHELSTDALRAIVRHSGHRLEKLSILGWRNVEADAVSELAECKHLAELNMAWCRNVTDFTVKDILDGCDSINTVRVWGCNQLTDRVPRKRGVKVIGIETHAI